LSAALTDIQAGTPGAWSSLWSIIHERSAQLFLEAASTQGVRKAVESLPAGERRFFESSAALELLALGRCLADPGMNAWRTWREVLREFTEWSRDAALRELGLVSFDDMIRLAADLVESHAAVRRAERSRLRAILVDEFQDTDPEQLRLLQALLQADREDGHEVLGFFVGDIKQSIYRFRGADVPSIRAFRDRYRELTGCSRDCVELRLTANFRSVLDVTDFVNDLFHQTLPLAGPEEWLQPRRSERIGPPVWIWIRSDASGQRLKAAQARRAAAFETARLVTTYLAEQPDGGASYSDILVLVNKGSELDIVVNALQQAGIPVVSSGTRTLYQHPEVLDLINLLITLHNPLDTLATAAVLRSPLVSLSDPDIFRLLKETPASELFHGARSLPAFVPKPAVERVEAVRRLWRDRETLPSWKWLQEVYAFLPLAAYSDPQDREGRALVRVQRVLNDFQAEGLSGATPPLVWLLERRARAEQVGRYDADLGEDVSVADERVDAVRVMTIHKAKGLEARCVILAGWAGTLGGIESPNRVGKPAVIRETQADGESRAAFRLEWGNLTVRSRHYAELMRQYEKREKEEAVRLSYVAATRACDRLSMVCAVSVRGRLPESVTALESALEAPSTERQGVSVLDGRLVLLRKTADESLPALFSSSAVELDLTTYRRLWEGRYQGLATPGPPPFRRPSQTEFPPDPEEPPSALAASPGGKDVHMAAGDLVHRYLERYLQDENFDPARLERLARAVDGGASRPASDLAERILRRFFSGRLAGPDGRPFTERARVGRVLAREFPVYLNIEGESWLGVIDLVLEEGGVVKAVDYKTTTVKAILPASYEQQRRIYSEALRRLFPGRQVEFEFWWLNGGGGSSLA
jgi:ATP-dependent exoDNAse (exonuclease V) beta subunit